MELYSVIQNDGPGNVLIWKCMNEDFNNHTQLIVAENEEALFVKDGIVVQTFGAGKYTLSTQNYPFINGLRKAVTGGKSPYTCKIYFVDKAHKLELFWGTDAPIQMRDPEFDFMVSVMSHGSYSVQVKDSKKFLVKMVGNNVQFFTAAEIQTFFRTAFVTKIKTRLAQYMKNYRQTVLDLQTELESLSETLTPELNEILDEYGVKLINFYVSDISIPEDDPNYAKINDAYARKGRMHLYGEDYGRLTGEMLLENMSTSPSAGAAAGAGMGMGMGMMAGGMMGGIAAQVFAPINQSMQQGTQQQPAPSRGGSRYAPRGNNSGAAAPKGAFCPSCGTENQPGAKFCCGCGEKLAADKCICPQCGAEMTPTARFCSECGFKKG